MHCWRVAVVIKDIFFVGVSSEFSFNFMTLFWQFLLFVLVFSVCLSMTTHEEKDKEGRVVHRYTLDANKQKDGREYFYLYNGYSETFSLKTIFWNHGVEHEAPPRYSWHPGGRNWSSPDNDHMAYAAFNCKK